MSELPIPPATEATTATWKSPVSIASVLSALSAAPFVIEDLLRIDLGIPAIWRARLLAVAAIIRVLLPYLLRHSTVVAVKNVEAVAEVAKERADVAAAKADIMAEATTLTAARVEQVAAVTADALDPHTETPADAVAVLRGVETAPRGFEGP